VNLQTQSAPPIFSLGGRCIRTLKRNKKSLMILIVNPNCRRCDRPFLRPQWKGNRTTSNTQTFTFPPLPLDGTSKPVAENTVFAEAHYFLSKGITSIHLYYYLKKMNAEDGYTDWKQFQSFLGKSALKPTLKIFLFSKSENAERNVNSKVP